MKITSLYFFFITLLMGIVSAKLTITITDDQIVLVFVPRFKEKVAFEEINDIIEENRNTYINKEKFENKKKEFDKSNIKEHLHNAYTKVHQGVKDQSVISAYVSPKIVEKIKALPYVTSIEKNSIFNQHDDEVKIPHPSKSNDSKPVTIVRTTTIAKTTVIAKTKPVANSVTKTDEAATTTQSNSASATPVNNTNTSSNDDSKANDNTSTNNNNNNTNENENSNADTTTTSSTNSNTNEAVTSNGNSNTNTNSTLGNVVSGTNQQNSTNTQQVSSAQTHSILKMFNLFFILILTINLLF